MNDLDVECIKLIVTQEESGMLQPIELQGVGHNLMTEQQQQTTKDASSALEKNVYSGFSGL